MENKIANPAPLGLFAFASTTWLLSLINAGLADGKGLVLVLAMALVFGGTVQAIAGILAFLRGNTFPGVAFLAYGAFWISLATYVKFFGGGAGPFIGWYLFVWGVFSFYMWIAAFRHNTALQLTFLALWITFFLLAIGDGFGIPLSTTFGRLPRARDGGSGGLSLRGGDHQRRLWPDDPSDRAVRPGRPDPGPGWREDAFGLVNKKASGDRTAPPLADPLGLDRHVQSSTILPELPRRMISNPWRNSTAGRRCVMTLRTASPLSSMAIILCQVSNISRP